MIFVSNGEAAFNLTGTQYVQDFNAIGSAIPSDWTVRTGATATALGTTATLNTTATAWSDSAGSFKNMASTAGLGSADAAAIQSASTNRALALRQTGAFGDPGASFNFNFNTTGFTLSGLTLNLEMLSVQTRSTTWSVQAGVGAVPASWTTLTTYADPGIFGRTSLSFNAAELASFNNQAEVWFRVVALSGSSGGGSRDSFGVDDFTLNYAPLNPGLFWDTNSTVAGAGVTPTGTWGTDAFWSTSDAGTLTTGTWTAGENATFSAGTDGVNPFVVTVTGTQSVGGISVQEGSASFNAGTLDFSDSSPIFNVDSGALAAVSSPISGTNGFIKAGLGMLTLSGTNTFTGSVSVSSGTLAISSDNALGDAANDLVVNGTLAVTTSLSLPATRDLSGNATLNIAPASTLSIPGAVNASGVSLANSGTLALTGATRNVGALSFSTAATLDATGTVSATGISATALTSGIATVNPALDLGVSTANATVDVGTGGRINLESTVAKGTATAGYLLKTGAGTLKLGAANVALYAVQLGVAGTSTTNGGVLDIATKDSLGAGGTPTLGQFRFNYGTLNATTALTAANAIANSVSLGGRGTSPAILAGSAMEFSGALSVFGPTGTSGDIVMNVNNQTIWSGAVSVATGTTVTGLTLGGSGRLTLTGALTGLVAPLTIAETLILELNTSDVGAAASPSTDLIVQAGASLAVGTVGATRTVTAYKGLNGVTNSILRFDLGGTTRGTEYDALILAKPTATVAGPITFAGKLDVDLISSFVPAAGQSFDLLDWDATVTPNFAGIDFSQLPALGIGLIWDTSAFATTGTISVMSSSVNFTISDQPDSVTVDPNTSVTFTVAATGPGPFTYQWRKGLVTLTGETSVNSYTIASAQEADEGSYFVDVRNASGTLSSNAAVLTVNTPIVPVNITGHPASLTLNPSATATFTVTVNAASTGPFTYQWRKATIAIPTATSASYSIGSVVEGDEGSYDVVVTGPGTGNSQTSNAATLTVNDPPPPGPINITGNGSYTENFNIMGTGTTPAYPNGWTAIKTAGNNAVAIGGTVTNPTTNTGASNAGAVYNYGTTSNADRALGSLASGGITSAYGASFNNTSGSTIEGPNIRLAFRSEQWRQSDTAANEVWLFEWKIGGNFNDSTGWSGATVFNINEVLTAAVAGAAVDGNATGNFSALALTNFAVLTGWESGQTLHVRWRDTDDTGSDAGMSIDDFEMEISGVLPPAPKAYWDADGNVAGAGGATPAGIWGTNTFWSSSDLGTLATAGWTAGNDAVFAAGVDATGSYTVTLSSQQDVSGVVFEEGQVTLTGNTLNFTDATPTLLVGTAATATVNSIISGSNGLRKQGVGELVLGGVNSFTGAVVIGTGTVTLASDSALGAVANDLLLNGTLKTTATFDVSVGRDITGGGSFAPAAGTELGVLGAVSMTSLTLINTGTLDLRATASTIGAVNITAPGTLQGGALSVTDIVASHASSSATIENEIQFGNTNRNVTVTNAAASLRLTGPLTLGGGGNNRLIKQGAGTLVLNGSNGALNRLVLGLQSATPINGGTIQFNNGTALGLMQMFFNYGTLEATAPVTGVNAVPVGLSISSRTGTTAGLAGSAMEFTGDSTLFSNAGTSGDIVMLVNNQTTFTGGLSGITSATITGLAVGGNGTLTLTGSLSSFATALKLRDTITIELNTSEINSSSALAYEIVSLDSGTTLAVATIGSTGSVTSYTSVNAAAGSSLNFDIAGTARGVATAGYDALIFAPLTSATVPATYTFAGTVEVDFITGFTPAHNQTFDLLDWDPAVTPNFTGLTFDLPDISGSNLIWDTSNFMTDGTLTILSNALAVEVTPPAQTLNVGATATFTANATGPGTIAYQWQKGTIDILGETNSVLTLSSITEADEGSYRCVVSNGVNSVNSNVVTLTVNPAIVGLLASRTPTTNPLFIGDSVTFRATGGGTGLNYQWRIGTTPIVGATSATYTISPLALTDSGDYNVLVSNGGPSVQSNTVSLTVLSPTPTISSEPPAQTLLRVGQAFSLQIVATGRPPLLYQWKRDGINIPGATRSSFSSPAATLAQGGTYVCEVSNAAGEVDASTPAQVGIVLASTVNINIEAGKNSSFRLQATGPNLSFVWKRNGGALPSNFSVSLDGKTLTGTALTIDDFGTYACTVSLGLLTQVGGTNNLKVFDRAPESPTTVVMPDGIIGGTYTFEMPYTVSTPPREAPSIFSAKGLPTGLKMDSKTGIISGRPLKSSPTTNSPPNTPFTVVMTAKNTLGTTETTGTLLIKTFPTKLAGIYAALIEPSSDINGNLGGRLDLTISTTGTYTGSMTLGIVKYALKGLIEVDPTTPDAVDTLTSLSLIVPRKGDPVPLLVEIDLPLDADLDRRLSGEISDGTTSINTEGWRYVWNVKTGPVATDFVQYYTFATELAIPELIGADDSVPQGSGYGSFKVTPDGKLKIAGATGDGQKLTLSGFLSPDGEFVFYQTLYTPVKGSIIGLIDIEKGATPADNTVIGDLTQIRPANVKSRAFAAGFGPLDLNVNGAAYTPTLGNVALNLTAGSIASLTFTEAGLTDETATPSRADVTLRIDAKDKAVITAPVPSPTLTKFTSLKSATGLFAGSFVLDDANPLPVNPPRLKRTSKFQGIIVKEAGNNYRGYGYFLLDQLPTVTPPTTTKTSPNLSGHVEFAPGT